MTQSFEVLNQLETGEAKAQLTRCCGASSWVGQMVERRPFADQDALMFAADEVWQGLNSEDFLEAFTHHPQIGADIGELRKKFAATSGWSQNEQAGVGQADETVLRDLAAGNQQYLERFGFIFIVCASGKSAAEMLQLLQARISNDPDTELAIAAGEQAKITKLRLEKLTS